MGLELEPLRRENSFIHLSPADHPWLKAHGLTDFCIIFPHNMPAFLRRILGYIYLPIAWTILTIILLCLPGSTIPGIGLFNVPNLDKLVHFMLFGAMVFFWSYYHLQHASFSRWTNLVFIYSMATVVLGICLEFVQLYFIPNRGFDLWDIVANGLGSCVTAFFILWIEKKGSRA